MTDLSVENTQVEKPGNGFSLESWLNRKLYWKFTPAAIILILILLVSLGLHLYRIDEIGNGNAYYTAAVKSMLQSWHNFFFVAAEPGGSVTVDKPPLGFWIQALFGLVLGVNGFTVTLPSILAGIASIWVLYRLVKKYLGTGPGLVAAIVMATTPVTLATDRNNTIDSLLIFTLLLAAWAFIRATENGKLKHLLLGGLLVGLAFNIKMLEAFLPLPAFYALYLFGSKTGWGRKLLNLGITSVLLLGVAFSWAVIVDAVPADQRPYVGSSSTNSEMDLIFGYNGVERLLGMGRNGFGGSTGLFGSADGGNSFNPGGARNGGSAPGGPGAPGNGRIQQPPITGSGAGGFLGGMFARSGGGMFEETGTPGLLRFFQAPLAKEMSWLLPFALLALLLGIFSSIIRLPLDSPEHKSVLLWGGWLMTCLVFFSMAGFFHNYYLALLTPALGASVATGFSALAKLRQKSHLLAGILLIPMAGLTLLFEITLASSFDIHAIWFGIALVGLGVAVMALVISLLWRSGQPMMAGAVNLLALLAMLVVPALWTYDTVSIVSLGGNLPAAYSGQSPQRASGSDGQRAQNVSLPGEVDGANLNLINYLEQHTQDTEFMVAVQNAQTGAPLVLATGRPVFYLGGFTGSDPVIDAAGFARLVQEGRLRYVLLGGMGGRNGSSSVESWVTTNCTQVSDLNSTAGLTNSFRGGFGGSLYQCGSSGL